MYQQVCPNCKNPLFQEQLGLKCHVCGKLITYDSNQEIDELEFDFFGDEGKGERTTH